jgi:methionyl aminopeptidase
MEIQKTLILSHLIKSGRILASCLDISKKMIKDGFSSSRIDEEVEKFILSNGAVPSFKGLHDFPFSTCISFNEQVVHGLPSDRKAVRGDVVTVDIGVSYKGHCTDAARTYTLGRDDRKTSIIQASYRALEAGISQCIESNTVGDISFSIQKEIEGSGFRTPLEIGGHGLGLEPHEDPFIPNYGPPKTGMELIYGMVLAIEPIVMEKDNSIEVSDDGFTIVSSNGYLSSHVEDSIVVTDKNPLILTRRTLEDNLV